MKLQFKSKADEKVHLLDLPSNVDDPHSAEHSEILSSFTQELLKDVIPNEDNILVITDDENNVEMVMDSEGEWQWEPIPPSRLEFGVYLHVDDYNEIVIQKKGHYDNEGCVSDRCITFDEEALKVSGLSESTFMSAIKDESIAGITKRLKDLGLTHQKDLQKFCAWCEDQNR